MIESPHLTLDEQRKLIEGHVYRAIHATVIRYEYRTREEYDGEGKEILRDFVVLWEQPEAAQSYRRWGVHSGVIRHRKGEKVTADIFWGHYDLEEEKAKEVYAEKVRRLTPRWE